MNILPHYPGFYYADSIFMLPIRRSLCIFWKLSPFLVICIKNFPQTGAFTSRSFLRKIQKCDFIISNRIKFPHPIFHILRLFLRKETLEVIDYCTPPLQFRKIVYNAHLRPIFQTKNVFLKHIFLPGANCQRRKG